MHQYSPHSSDAILECIDREIALLDELDPLTDERYHETHDDFENASNQRELILAWLEQWAGAALWPTDRRADVLSVGCGGGTMDMRIADVFSQHSRSIRLAGVDPNPRHTEAFAACFADRATEVTVATSSFEAYETDHQFDVIHSVHCLYYFEHIEPALKRAMRMLRPGGWLIVLLAPNEALNAIANVLWRKQLGHSAWYSDDVLPVMQSLGGELQQHRIDAHVDITRCLDAQDELGRRVLDFIAQADTSAFTPHLQALLRAHLASIAHVDRGRHIAPHPVDAIAVRRCE